MCNRRTFAKLIPVSKNLTFPILLCNHYAQKPISCWLNPKNLNLNTRSTHLRKDRYVHPLPKFFSVPTASSAVGNYRFYCTEKKPDLPKLMDFPQVVWPSVFKTLRNWILSNFIVMRYFDQDFNLPDFVEGSKQAVELVSSLISKGDTESLSGLVTPEVIAQVKESLEVFTLKQRQEFSIKADDIYFSFPYEVGVMFPNEEKDEKQSRFVEITMCYHALQGLKEMRDQGISPGLDIGVNPEHQDKIFICNYRFIREFTKGVNDDWTINAINHFKPAVMI